MVLFLCGFFLSVMLTAPIARAGWRHGHRGRDGDFSEARRLHARAVSRVGGLALLAALVLVAALLSPVFGGPWPLLARHLDDALGSGALLVLLLLVALPAFVVGLLDDLTRKVRVRWRLLGAILSGLLGAGLLDAVILRTDLPVFESIAAIPLLGPVFLAVFTVVGIANAVNIIDGLHGLASLCMVMVLLALALVAHQLGDAPIAETAALGAGVVLGFFLWNYPAGLVFLGDGGAYLLGVFTAQLGILLVRRHPEVSPLFPLLLLAYPIFETLFSMYRRRVLRRRPMVSADAGHLHSLLFRRLLKRARDAADVAALTRANALTAPYLWLLCAMAVVPAVLFHDDSRLLGGFLLLFALSYIAIYLRIVRFRVPPWMPSRR